MKRVLIVTYDFPPTGGGGVLRMQKFCKYLPEFDWQPVVVTLKNSLAEIRDEQLLDELSDHVVIHYTRTLEPFWLTRIFRKWGGGIGYARSLDQPNGTTKRRFLFGLLRKALKIPQYALFPDKGIFWFYPAVKRGRQVIENSDIDLIMTSSPPHSIHLIGRYLSRRYRLPWVIDFRDGWTDIPLYSHPNRLLKKAELRLESKILGESDGVLCATAPITASLRKRLPPVQANKFVTITNGFDWDDLEPIEYGRSEKLVFTHAGVIGGVRSTKYLFEALKQVKTRDPEVYKDLTFRFIGRFTDDMDPWRKELNECFVHIPHRPHKETFPLLQMSDVLFIVIQWNEGANTFLTTKFFDYLSCKRPIFAMIPPSPLKDMIEQHGLGKVVCSDDVSEIRGAILDFHREWKADCLCVDPSSHLLSRFDRRSLTGNLVRFFDRVSETARGANHEGKGQIDPRVAPDEPL